MFAYIKGSLEEIGNNFVVVDVGGVGFKIFMSSNALRTIGELGDIVKVHTYHYVREDIMSLYGFLSNDELKMFELLLSVSGIGAKTAIAMLSNITPSSFALAIINNDIKSLTKIPGIGAKGAQRIVLELQDKLKSEQRLTAQMEIEEEKVDTNENSEEAISALQILGYNKKEIEKALSKQDLSSFTTEEIIKLALKNLAR